MENKQVDVHANLERELNPGYVAPEGQDEIDEANRKKREGIVEEEKEKEEKEDKKRGTAPKGGVLQSQLDKGQEIHLSPEAEQKIK